MDKLVRASSTDGKIRAFGITHKELVEKGQEVNYDDILREIELRDYQDTHRDLNPLRQADDAVYLDTSDLTIEQNIDAIADIISEKCGDISCAESKSEDM